jgi:N-acetylglucosaminyldiphosphoundecaprenol N-acetyl-beta-D-mannosaminyltransferase
MSVNPIAPRVNILGVGVSATSLHQCTRLILDAVRRDVCGYVAVTGVHGISEAYVDESFRRILNCAYLVTPDGMPLSWIGRWEGFSGMDRVYGPDLMSQVFASTTDGSVRHFFYGGAEGVAERLLEEMESRFPGVCVAGTFTPPFRALTKAEFETLREQIRLARADIVWVGLSTPKQERFMAARLDELDTKLMIGVGAAFDFFTGRVRQAPYWMQRSGLEWLFRLVQEPRRLGRRYLVNNPLFLLRLLGHYTGIRKRALAE